jgi:circadian clock protein KaiC
MDLGLLQIHSSRPTSLGLEAHLLQMYQAVREFDPRLVIMDPVTNLVSIASKGDVQEMLVRLLDYLKGSLATSVCTHLSSAESLEATDVGVSSIMDTWLQLRDVESGGERNRAIFVLKSRGMAHSNQIREFRITPSGVTLMPSYLGSGFALTGSARLSQEVRERNERIERDREAAGLRREIERRRQDVEAQIDEVRRKFEADERELLARAAQLQDDSGRAATDRGNMAASRRVVDAGGAGES